MEQRLYSPQRRERCFVRVYRLSSNLLSLLHPSLVLFESNQNAKPGWTELARLTVNLTGIIKIERGSMIVQVE